MKKCLIFLMLICITVAVLCSCSGDILVVNRIYKSPKSISVIDSGIIASNYGYSLSWDSEKYSLEFDAGNDKWVSSPNEFILSSLEISYIEQRRSLEVQTNSEDLLSSGGFVSAKKIDDGVRLIYYFDSIEICVPIEYKITKNGLNVSVLVDGIREKENKIYSVSVLPYFASAPNNTDSYLFVPSGCGALMYTDEDHREVRNYEEPVYGNDEANQEVFKNNNTESIKLPVFGVKRENSAIVGILDNGAECANIVAQSGNKSKGYSYVYPKFILRGYSNSYVKTVEGNNSEVKKYTDNIIGLKRVSITYIPILDSDKSYLEMANVYRRYLIDNNEFFENEKHADLMINVFGSTRVRKLFLGVPYYSLTPATTLNGAKEIISDISKHTSGNVLLNLKGFGDSGLDYGKAGNGFEISSKMGKIKDLNSLNNWCKSNDVVLSYDLDTVYFNKSSKGYSTSFDTAKTTSGISIKKLGYNLVTGKQDSSRGSTYLLQRSLLCTDLLEDISNFASEFNVNSLCLSSISHVAYSDYSDINYYCKTNMARDVTYLFNKLKKNTNIVCNNANSYASNISDYILNSPTNSSLYSDLDCDIPFYQILYRGYKPISGRSINLASEPVLEFLKSVSTGSALMFSVCDNYCDDYIVGIHEELALSQYDGIKEMIFNFTDESKAYFSAIENSKIKLYEISNNVSHTVFDNGVEVYVNFNDKQVETSFGTINAESFEFRAVK